MVVDIEITFKERAEDGRKTERVRTFRVDSEDMPLALAGSDIDAMRHSIANFLDLTEAESVQLTIRHLKKIGAAMKAANEIPN